MDIEKTKKFMKEQAITYDILSQLSGIPLNTIKNIFCGKTQNPRIETIQAIEKALGLDKEKTTDISEEEKNFLLAFRQLTEEEKNEFLSIADFILSKRK